MGSDEAGVREKCIVALYRVFAPASVLEAFSLPRLSAWQIRAVTPPDLAPDSDKHCKHSVKWLRQRRSHATEHTKPAAPPHRQTPPALPERPECFCACEGTTTRVFGSRATFTSSAHMRVTPYLLSWCVSPRLYLPRSPNIPSPHWQIHQSPCFIATEETR